MRHMPFIRATGLVTLLATAMSPFHADARGFGGGFHGGGFGGGLHGGGFHGGGFASYRSAGLGGFRGARAGRTAAHVGHSFLLENQSNPAFATGF